MDERHFSNRRLDLKAHSFNIKEDLAKLSELCRKKEEFKNFLLARLSVLSDPHTYILDLILASMTSPRMKVPAVTQQILTESSSWLQMNNLKCQLSKEQKQQALDLIMTKSVGSTIPLLCKLFEMEKDRLSFRGVIYHHLTLGNYSQAAYAVCALSLGHTYELEEIAVPLFFLNLMGLVHSYFERNPEMQLKFAKLLDKGCSDRQAFANFRDSFFIVNMKPTDKRDCTWLRKGLSKFIKHFKISIDECPNLKRNRNFGAIAYLIHKRYSKASISDEGFQEMALAAAGNDLMFQKEFLTKLVCYNEFPTALKLAQSFKLTDSEWPSGLYYWVQDNLSTLDDTASAISCADQQQPNEEVWGVPSPQNECLALRLCFSDIHLVDTLQKFEKCIDDIVEGYNVVGIDAEWRPTLGLSSDITGLSLFQIATWDDAYLIDVPALSKCIGKIQWKRFAQKIFYNPHILKLGYGVKNDMKLLLQCCGINEELNKKNCNILDFEKFYCDLINRYPVLKSRLNYSVKRTSKCEHKGLSKICYSVLGKPLNKEDQFSDWERRPLRTSQMTYAALDAFCLLQVYEKLFREMGAINFDLTTAIRDFFESKPKEKKFDNNVKTKEPSSSAKNMKIGEGSSSKPMDTDNDSRVSLKDRVYASDFKVVVDNHLAGLMKQLRMYGIDAIQDQNFSDFGSMVNTCLSQNRIILTSGSKFLKVKGYVAENMCFDVQCNLSAVEQARIVCEFYNVVIREDDVFSRCTVCNSNSYLRVSREDLELLWSLHITHSKPKKHNVKLKPLVIWGDNFICEDGLINNNVEVQFDDLNSGTLMDNNVFLICSKCGKVYWEGSHHRRAKETISERITTDSYTRTVQHKPNNTEMQSLPISEPSTSSNWSKSIHYDKSNKVQVQLTNTEISKLTIPKHTLVENKSAAYYYPDGYEEEEDETDDFVYF